MVGIVVEHCLYFYGFCKIPGQDPTIKLDGWIEAAVLLNLTEWLKTCVSRTQQYGVQPNSSLIIYVAKILYPTATDNSLSCMR
jgi:hypothetical protein